MKSNNKTWILTENSWHLQMNRLIFGSEYIAYSMCPYFWKSVVVFLLFPILIIGKHISKFIEKKLEKTAKEREAKIDALRNEFILNYKTYTLEQLIKKANYLYEKYEIYRVTSLYTIGEWLEIDDNYNQAFNEYKQIFKFEEINQESNRETYSGIMAWYIQEQCRYPHITNSMGKKIFKTISNFWNKLTSTTILINIGKVLLFIVCYIATISLYFLIEDLITSVYASTWWNLLGIGLMLSGLIFLGRGAYLVFNLIFDIIAEQYCNAMVKYELKSSSGNIRHDLRYMYRRSTIDFSKPISTELSRIEKFFIKSDDIILSIENYVTATFKNTINYFSRVYTKIKNGCNYIISSVKLFFDLFMQNHCPGIIWVESEDDIETIEIEK